MNLSVRGVRQFSALFLRPKVVNQLINKRHTVYTSDQSIGARQKQNNIFRQRDRDKDKRNRCRDRDKKRRTETKTKIEEQRQKYGQRKKEINQRDRDKHRGTEVDTEKCISIKRKLNIRTLHPNSSQKGKGQQFPLPKIILQYWQGICIILL